MTEPLTSKFCTRRGSKTGALIRGRHMILGIKVFLLKLIVKQQKLVHGDPNALNIEFVGD